MLFINLCAFQKCYSFQSVSPYVCKYGWEQRKKSFTACASFGGLPQRYTDALFAQSRVQACFAPTFSLFAFSPFSITSLNKLSQKKSNLGQHVYVCINVCWCSVLVTATRGPSNGKALGIKLRLVQLYTVQLHQDDDDDDDKTS